jgi:hypothetical protein
MRPQEGLRPLMGLAPPLASEMNEKGRVAKHQGRRGSRDRRRRATAALMAVHLTPRPNRPDLTSPSRSAAVALARGKVIRRTTAEKDSPRIRVAFSRS